MIALRPLPLALLASAACAGVAGCGGSTPQRVPVSARIEPAAGSSSGRIVLSRLGAQRIGLHTVRAHAAPTPQRLHGMVVVPYSAIVYDPSGQTFAFVSPARLTYVEVQVAVDHIAGRAAYLTRGLRPGDQVVSVGAEELYGVQSGVLAQT